MLQLVTKTDIVAIAMIINDFFILLMCFCLLIILLYYITNTPQKYKKNIQVKKKMKKITMFLKCLRVFLSEV